MEIKDVDVIKCCGRYPLIDRPHGSWLMECPKCHCSSSVQKDDKKMYEAFKAAQVEMQK